MEISKLEMKGLEISILEMTISEMSKLEMKSLEIAYCDTYTYCIGKQDVSCVHECLLLACLTVCFNFISNDSC